MTIRTAISYLPSSFSCDGEAEDECADERGLHGGQQTEAECGEQSF